MAKAIMVQGTMSNAGKSLLTAGLCRVFKQDGYTVAPFKSQNMALNSFITDEGLEMGRAQVVQAEACGIEPDVMMNPILLKPVTDVGSQVIVNGEVRGNMTATQYFAMKRTLFPEVMKAYDTLADAYDIIVIEGAGSPAEINLHADDIVNMGMAKHAKAPVLLVGDIDRGGVFAQLYGTMALLDESERSMVKALVINKFRGDVGLLTPGLAQLEKLTGTPIAGVLPYLHIDIDDEDSLSERFDRPHGDTAIDIAVIRLPYISNFTDFSALDATDGIAVRYVDRVSTLGQPDMVIIPGTKSTIADLKWLRQSGLEAAVKGLAARGSVVFGVCGGYQILGERITDTEGVEGGGTIDGIGLLPILTEFEAEKHRTRVAALALDVEGALRPLSAATIEGYEIHMGRSTRQGDAPALVQLDNGTLDGCQSGNVYGSYLHGFFDTSACREKILQALCTKKGISAENLSVPDRDAYKEAQYDLLAQAVRDNLDIRSIYRIMEEGI